MTTGTFTLPSFAKINWFLRVFGVRDDGYHEICTALQTISLCDVLTFSRSDEFIFSCTDQSLPVGNGNLVVQAASALRKHAGVSDGARVHLKKNIPHPGGLGGGSSNAATALLGLAKLWDLRLSPGELTDLASKLGSDVSFFLYGGTALGHGRGTEIEPLPDLPPMSLLVVAPATAVPTSRAYAKLGLSRLTKDAPKSILKICLKEAQRLISGDKRLFNDFETAVFELAPEAKNVYEKLKMTAASEVLLSGSGSCVFGIFDNDEKRRAALKMFDDYPRVRCFAVQTVSRQGFGEALAPCNDLLPKVP